MSNRAVDLLKQSRVFHIATVEGNQPRVRPFGAVADIEGKLYLCTNNTKEFFKQIKANPNVEISATLGAEKWIRISGTIEIDGSISAREKFLQLYPLPKYKADDGIFEVFFFNKGTVTIYSFLDLPESFEL